MVLKTYTLNKEVTLDLLDTQITNSNSVIGFSGLNFDGTSLEVMGDSISDETTLDITISIHVATPAPTYKLTDTTESPLEKDYDLYGLHKKETFNQGELNLVEYFKEYDGITHSNLVIREERVYARDANNLAQFRTQTSSWYLSDDTVGCTKTTVKYYTIQTSIEESEKRRTNLVSDAKLYTLSQIGIENCWDFIQSINSEIQLYIQGATQYLKDAITNSTKVYLTPTIKGTILYIITID